MLYCQHDPERGKMPRDQAFLLRLFWCYSTSPAEPRGALRWESQMERTRAHNKDKWLEHEIWFIALVQKRSQGNGQHWHAMNFKTLSNPKSTRPAAMTLSLSGAAGATRADCGANQSGCCFWWTAPRWVVWGYLKDYMDDFYIKMFKNGPT